MLVHDVFMSSLQATFSAGASAYKGWYKMIDIWSWPYPTPTLSKHCLAS